MNKKEIIGKSAIHSWLNVNYGKPKVCEGKKCNGKSTWFDWANIKNHQYRRVREDFVRLCRSCHRKFDKIIPPARKGKTMPKDAIEKIKQAVKNRKRKNGKYI